ncbi:hypothetical protein FDA09_16915 [Clostridium botulinum]|uniref:MazG nucleotide pyrophosphohydrolase domain-containing protein n=1 Tax=Clostridium botulinum TaxID=1491 RepID=UPI000773D7FA|nr:MazG nucleotide pyrophosphohydrolase domain-containing protein [Clostridium botulinum]NFH81786.1 hypothetical protein [Clostridium botulinum]NFH85041.1 hypothetical protein [Clostridium botulinum]NFI13022.1 hypothetical protein [Clostridium botulinum]NFI16277.1 hypothetical protein [Clostridium botulinum]NFO86040.1 hypothetical protein [Clostridium botulinum]
MISIEKQTEICNKAIRTFGEHTQMIKTMEELGELTRAISRVLLGQGEERIENLHEEIADVEIMLMQLKGMCYVSKTLVDDWKAKKFKNLEGVVW